MPGISGHELAERLREHHPGLRVLFVSGYAPESLRGELPGGLHFLAKPYAPEDLVRRVREVLDDVG
jgi:two-component system cell cycle sensor histidine kinase/response regulator CckA